ncbi:hypothetical protein L2K20_24905 [Mycobacterium sp. MBM]|nr:hypothetical protein [Mycobacterium sp. MBM]
MNHDARTADPRKSTTPPGPTDQGRTGGMATREVNPDVVQKHRDQAQS